MKIGTKSVLYGAHCLLIHPVFVLIAWIKLYGWPWDPRLWIAFFVHDLGYWGKPNIDGEEGVTHPELGAFLMHKWFDRSFKVNGSTLRPLYWYNLCYYHSRSLSKKDGRPCSKLYAADKLAMALEPKWLYLPRVNWTGEINEYMEICVRGFTSQDEWYDFVKEHLRKRAYEHTGISN